MKHQDKARPRGRLVAPEHGRSILFGAIFLMLFWVNACLAENTNKSQILFLHLKVSNQQISLIEKIARPGVLKRHREATGEELHVELISTTGEVLWKGAVADPAFRDYEYEDPPGSGTLHHKSVPMETAEFTVRIPSLTNAQRVDFYKLEVAPPSSSSSNSEKHLSKKLLGSVTLP